MIPAIRIPPFEIWGLEFHAFGILVGIAILVGAYLAAERAEKVGLSRRRTNDLVLWLLGGGFVLAHLVAVVFYHPDRIAENPWVLVQIWNGISSVGGFFGALIAFFVFARYYRLPKMAYADVCAYALSFGWIFGRMGCATAHDHKGCLTDFPLAVAFKGGSRHDLGLYEMVLAIVITLVLFLTRKRQLRVAPGLHVGLLAVLYAPVRFGLDFLRATDLEGSDLRYLGLTAAQYASLAILAIGVAVLVWRRNQPAWAEYLARAGVREDGEVGGGEPAKAKPGAEEPVKPEG